MIKLLLEKDGEEEKKWDSEKERGKERAGENKRQRVEGESE